MKLANLFGFSGDRRLGLQALEFASHSQDMKAPLARYLLIPAITGFPRPLAIHVMNSYHNSQCLGAIIMLIESGSFVLHCACV